MKKSILPIVLLAAIFAASSVAAGPRSNQKERQTFVDRARVLKVIPVYREYREYRDTERRTDRDRAEPASAHTGKSGARLTSMHRYNDKYDPYGYREYREIISYKVKYKFRDNKYWTMMDRAPGRYIDIRVEITPIG